jgi:hypothetical protein
MVSEAQNRAQAKYDKANTKMIQMKLNLKTDADILEKLASVGNKQGYIKALIRADIEAQKTKQYVNQKVDKGW